MARQEIEFRDPADLPEASLSIHPVDAIEPIYRGDIDFAQAADLLSEIVLAISERDSLVDKGRAVQAICAAYAPETIRASFGIERYTIKPADIIVARRFFMRIFKWLVGKGGSTLSMAGFRGILLVYLVRPDLIQGATLEDIASASNHTRQSMSKQLSELRDICGGFKNRAMKQQTTRTKCQMAHTK